MWFVKNICVLCDKKFPKSELKEYETIQNNKIICCEKCSKTFINKKRDKY